MRRAPDDEVETTPQVDASEVRHVEKMEKRLEGWKRYLAFTYILVILVDFAIMPVVFEINRPDFSEVATVIGTLSPEAQLMALNKTSWQPVTLTYSALFHVMMGGLLTGVAVFNNRYSNNPQTASKK